MAEKEYIERDMMYKFIELFNTQYSDNIVLTKASLQHLIDIFPSADVEPVRHGRWIKTANTWTHDYNERSKPIYYCSLCGRYEKLKEPYCNCGAKMDGGEQK